MELNNKFNGLSLKIKINEERLNKAEDKLDKMNQLSLLDTIENPHRYMYSAYKYSANSYYIQKTGGSSGTSNNFIYYTPIEINTIKSYTFRLISGNDNLLGICTKNNFGKINSENYYNMESLSFGPVNGAIHVNGGHYITTPCS